MKKCRIWLSLLLAGFVTLALSVEGAGEPPLLLGATNPLGLALYVLLVVGFYQALPHLAQTRLWVPSVCAGSLLSACYCTGERLDQTARLSLDSPMLYLRIVGVALLFAMLFLLLFHFLAGREHKPFPAQKQLAKWLGDGGKRTFFLCLGVMALCYLPAFLAAYPGSFSFDGPIQAQWFHEGVLDAHHPLLSTFLLGGWIEIGQAVFGSYNAGLALYSIFQAACLLCALSYACCMMLKYRVPRLIVLLSLLFFALNPYLQVFAFATIKEVLFGAVLLWLVLFSIELLLEPNAFFHSVWKQARYVLAALLMCLLRNQGIYMFILFVPFILWACRCHKARLAGLCLATVAIYGVFTGPICSALGVTPTRTKEALSVPMQQLARVLYAYPDRVTDEEKSIVYEILPPEVIVNYRQVTADPVKDGFDEARFKADPMRYVRVYLSIASKNLDLFAESFLLGCYGYFYPGMDATVYQPRAFYNPFEWINVYDIQHQSLFPFYEKALRALIDVAWIYDIPVLSLAADLAFPFWLMVVASAYLIYRKRWRLLAPLVLWFGFWGTLLLGPVTLSRYVFPLILAVPVLVGIVFMRRKEEKEEDAPPLSVQEQQEAEN